MPDGDAERFDWFQAGRTLAEKLLGAGMSPFQLSDLAYRYGVLVRQLGPRLGALGPPPGAEAGAAGSWVRHVDGREVFLSEERVRAENAFNEGWDLVVDGALRERTLKQGRADVDDDPRRVPEFLVTLGLGRDCTVEDVKRAYHSAAMAAHPDQGGDHELFLTLSRARAEALRWIEERNRLRSKA